MINIMKHIYNASLSSGIFPSNFKKAILKFMPKPNKDDTQVLNYRPISLLETVGKVYEKLKDKRLRHQMGRNDLYNKEQHCGRPQRGTQTAIAVAYEETAHSQQDRGQCNSMMRDVSKAFDKVWHNGLKCEIIMLT